MKINKIFITAVLSIMTIMSHAKVDSRAIHVYTHLGDRVTFSVRDQPIEGGKNIGPKNYLCGATSGKCDDIQPKQKMVGQYAQATDQLPSGSIFFTVKATQKPTPLTQTAGTFSVSFAELENIGLKLGGELLITGDEYQRQGCITRTSNTSPMPFQVCPNKAY